MSHKTILPLFVIAAFFLPNSFIQAQSTWTGLGDNENWSDPDNWDVAPTNGADLNFPDTIAVGDRSLNNDGALTSVNNIVISGHSWLMEGSAITWTGTFRQQTAGTGQPPTVWAIDMELAAGTRQFERIHNHRQLEITGRLTGTGGIRLSVDSSLQGDLILSNDTNSFTGTPQLYAGRTHVTSLADSGQNSSLGAGTTIELGTTASSNPAELIYVGSGDTSTNRSLVLRAGGGNATRIVNNSPNNGNLSFTNTAAVSVTLSTADRYLGFDGSSTGITTFDGLLTTAGLGIRLREDMKGIVRLTNNNSYGFTTLIDSGTLWIDGNQSGATGDVLVQLGGTLGGGGTVGGETSIWGSISPGGAAIRTLTIANDVTWHGAEEAGDADWLFRLGSSGQSDRLTIAGGDFLAGPLAGVHRFDFLNTGQIGDYVLISWTGLTDFSVEDFSYTNLANGLSGQFSLGGGELVFQVIPEPSTALLSLLAFGALLLGRRWRSGSSR